MLNYTWSTFVTGANPSQAYPEPSALNSIHVNVNCNKANKESSAWEEHELGTREAEVVCFRLSLKVSRIGEDM